MKKILTPFVAVALVSAILFSFAACSSGEEEKEVSTDAVSYTKSAVSVNKSSEDVLNYFNTLLNGIKTSKPAITYKIEKNIPNDSLKITKKGETKVDSSLKAMNDSAKGVKSMVLKDIKSTEGKITYGSENSDILFVKGESWCSKLTDDDIDYAQMNEVGDYDYIKIAFKDLTDAKAQEVLTKAFDLRDKNDILQSAEIKKAGAYLKLNNYDVSYSGCVITAKVNRLTNELLNVNYYKKAIVAADTTGVGTFASYGNLTVNFNLEDKANFDIVWDSGNPTSPLDTTTTAVSAASK